MLKCSKCEFIQSLISINNDEKNNGQQPEVRCFQAGSMILWVPAVFGVVVGLHILRIPLKVDGQALILLTGQHFTGQDQMFGFFLHALYPTASLFTPHSNKRERLLADAEVVVEDLPPLACAHIPDSLQV